jgi:hypothetical protein
MVFQGCSLIKNINSNDPERLVGNNLATLVGDRQMCEHVQNRFEQISKLGWALGGALLFKVCYVGLFRGEKQWCNAAYVGAALTGAAWGTSFAGRAHSYGRLVETFKEVEAWCAEPVQQLAPKVNTQELESQVKQMSEVLKKVPIGKEEEIELGFLVRYVLALHAASDLKLKVSGALRELQAQPKVPARLCCWKRHAEAVEAHGIGAGISRLW